MGFVNFKGNCFQFVLFRIRTTLVSGRFRIFSLDAVMHQLGFLRPSVTSVTRVMKKHGVHENSSLTPPFPHRLYTKNPRITELGCGQMSI